MASCMVKFIFLPLHVALVLCLYTCQFLPLLNFHSVTFSLMCFGFCALAHYQVVTVVTLNVVIHDNDHMYHPFQVYAGSSLLLFSSYRLKIYIIYFYINISNNNNVINTCTYTTYVQAVIFMIVHNPYIPLFLWEYFSDGRAYSQVHNKGISKVYVYCISTTFCIK